MNQRSTNCGQGNINFAFVPGNTDNNRQPSPKLLDPRSAVNNRYMLYEVRSRQISKIAVEKMKSIMRNELENQSWFIRFLLV